MSHVEASVLFFCEASHHKAPQLRWKKTTGGVHGITRCKAGAGLPRWKALSLNAAPAWVSHCVCTLGIHNESKQGHGKSKEAKLTMVCYSPQSLAEACASHLGHPRSIALIWFSQQADSTCDVGGGPGNMVARRTLPKQSEHLQSPSNARVIQLTIYKLS